jgi:pyridinium-3,5-biscarboxylic acid mononucleotide synthase
MSLDHESTMQPKSDDAINEAIARFQAGSLSPFELTEAILKASVRSSGSLTPDHDRRRRSGYAEVVYAEGKPIDALLKVIEWLLSQEASQQYSEILATRVSIEQARACCDQFAHVRWNSLARTLRVSAKAEPLAPEMIQGRADCEVVVVSAGTTDASVAQEAIETLAWMQIRSRLIQDIGVAGPYRLFAHLDALRSASALVVVAGMEGALPSVLAGHVSVPVIAVPTSVGYGANLGGIAALLSMLNSCASNVSVVNIDAGFRGGYLAGLIASRSVQP